MHSRVSLVHFLHILGHCRFELGCTWRQRWVNSLSTAVEISDSGTVEVAELEALGNSKGLPCSIRLRSASAKTSATSAATDCRYISNSTSLMSSSELSVSTTLSMYFYVLPMKYVTQTKKSLLFTLMFSKLKWRWIMHWIFDIVHLKF